MIPRPQPAPARAPAAQRLSLLKRRGSTTAHTRAGRAASLAMRAGTTLAAVVFAALASVAVASPAVAAELPQHAAPVVGVAQDALPRELARQVYQCKMDLVLEQWANISIFAHYPEASTDATIQGHLQAVEKLRGEIQNKADKGDWAGALKLCQSRMDVQRHVRADALRLVQASAATWSFDSTELQAAARMVDSPDLGFWGNLSTAKTDLDGSARNQMFEAINASAESHRRPFWTFLLQPLAIIGAALLAARNGGVERNEAGT